MLSNETKVAQLVLAHHAFVKALAFKLAPWPGLVDDISQQVFLEFLAKQERWDLEQDLRPLLATMTRLVAARHWRERKRAMPEVMRELADYVLQLAEEHEAPGTRMKNGRVADLLAKAARKGPRLAGALLRHGHFHGRYRRANGNAP